MHGSSTTILRPDNVHYIFILVIIVIIIISLVRLVIAAEPFFRLPAPRCSGDLQRSENNKQTHIILYRPMHFILKRAMLGQLYQYSYSPFHNGIGLKIPTSCSCRCFGLYEFESLQPPTRDHKAIITPTSLPVIGDSPCPNRSSHCCRNKLPRIKTGDSSKEETER